MYFATAPCTSLWTQLPHQDDHQSLNKTQTCQREHYAILFSDPVILNAYENKYRDVSHSQGGRSTLPDTQPRPLEAHSEENKAAVFGAGGFC